MVLNDNRLKKCFINQKRILEDLNQGINSLQGSLILEATNSRSFVSGAIRKVCIHHMKKEARTIMKKLPGI